MINPFHMLPFRFSYWLLKNKFKPKDDDFLSEVTQNFRSVPFDMDFNFHMHNSRYATFMDIGRLSYLYKKGVFHQILKKKWFPVLAGANYYFRRPINYCKKFTLKTKLLCWDEKWFYFRQVFLDHKGDIACVAYVKTTLIQKGKSISTNDILTKLGMDLQSPEIPEEILNWQEANHTFVEIAKTDFNK